jgi:hypothetical protein
LQNLLNILLNEKFCHSLIHMLLEANSIKSEVKRAQFLLGGEGKYGLT